RGAVARSGRLARRSAATPTVLSRAPAALLVTYPPGPNPAAAPLTFLPGPAPAAAAATCARVPGGEQARLRHAACERPRPSRDARLLNWAGLYLVRTLPAPGRRAGSMSQAS